VIDGVDLYVEQTALAFSTWTGVEPDKSAMREAAEEFLEL
jgi:shikimate 5-dehydrogenase